MMAERRSQTADGRPDHGPLSPSRRPRLLWASLGLSVLVAFVLALPGLSQSPEGEDPVPIRRVQVPAARLAAELERARAGILVPLSRAEFEKQVRRAAIGRSELPRLLRANYRAALGDNSLINGRGEWTVQHHGSRPAPLPLPDFNLALSQLRDADNKDAVLADIDGKSLGLVIDKAGNQKFYFDWTLRGVPSAGGQNFVMQVPACAAATLELRLPADQLLSAAPKAAMLSGPHESESPKHRLWRLNFTGRSQVEFAVKKQSGPEGKPAILASVQCRQQLLPGRCLADFEYQVEVLHGHVDRLVFACDPDLEPYEVTLKNLELKGWEIQEPLAAPAKGKSERLLIVSLREPVQGPLSGLEVRCLAPLAAERTWTSPGLRLRQALTRGEIIQMTLHPEVQLENWQPGQFQLLRSSVNPSGAQTLVLGRSGQDQGARPTWTARYRGVEFLARQKSWWHIGPRASTLTTEIVYEIHRGNLFQLALLLPQPHQDWTVEAVQLNPGKKAPTWVVAGNRLLINLDTPLTAADDGRLRVRLRSERRRPWPADGEALAFADVAPGEPCFHAGELGVSLDPALDARVMNTALSAGPVNLHGPWGKNALDFLFSYRQQPVAGTFKVQPRRPRLQAHVITEVVVSGLQAAWQTRLALEPKAGSPSSIDLAISGAQNHRLRWKSGTELVRNLVRLPVAEALPDLLALGCRSGLEQALLGLALPRGQRWRIEMAKPLDQHAEVILETTLEPAAADKDSLAWELPLVTVLDAEQHDMHVAIQALGSEPLQHKTVGLKTEEASVRNGQRPGLAPAGNGPVLSLQGDGSPFPQLTLLTRPQPGMSFGAAELCERAMLLSEWHPDGSLVHHFRFELLNWGKPSVPVVLPADARQVLGVRADGRWLDTFPRQITPDGVQVDLPVPATGFRHVLEVTYLASEAHAAWPIGGSLQAPMPRLPLPVLALQRRWRLPADLVPLRWSAYRETGGPSVAHDSLPGLAQLRRAWHLGDSLLVGLGMKASPDWIENQKQLLAAADVALRKKAAKLRQLGDLLQSLALDHMGDQGALVLDVAALEAAGLEPRTPIALAALAKSANRMAIWELAGLVFVPCRPAPLLTTRAWLDSQADRNAPARTAEAFSRPVQEAMVHGQDSTGRFRTVAAWLGSRMETLDEPYPLDGHAFLPNRLPGWIEWEPVPGQPQNEELTVVSCKFLDASGFVLALAMFFVARPIRKRLTGAWRFRLWLGWVGVALVSCIWLPSPFRLAGTWVLLAAVLLASLGWVRTLFHGRRPAAESPSRVTAALAALLATGLMLAPLSSARSGGEEPFTVFLLPGKDPLAQQNVLVPQELLQRLDRLAEAALPFRDAVVLVGARYRGAVHGSSADLKAEYSCFSFVDKGQLFVPLDGVDLQPGAFLDGAPVYPVVAPAPRNGYVVPVQGKGPHQLSLSFTARAAQAGENQQLRFSIPRLAQNQLVELLLPGRAQGAQAVGALGSQALGKAGNDWSLKAQLGPQKVMDVRWRSATGQPGPTALVEVRELYFWDLRLPLPNLSGILKYSISKGEISGFTLAMPEELEVHSVEVAAGPMSVSGPRLKSWNMRGAKDKRILAVDLLAPISGSVQLKLGMAPRFAVRPGNLSLPLPFPLQIKPAGFQEGFLAYRVSGLEARETLKDLGVVGIEPATFVKEWRLADPSSVVQPTRAVNFRRKSPKDNLGLSLLNPDPIASQEVTWEVQPYHADMTAVCEISAPASDLMMLEWHVPPTVVLADVHGPHVHSWTRQGSLVQVWLTQPQKETRVTLWGWLRNAVPLQPGKTGALSLPHVSLRQPAPTSTEVRLQPEQGLRLEPAQVTGLRPLRSEEAPRALLYAPTGTPGSEYAADFRLANLTVPPTFRSLTVAQARAGRLSFTADLAVHVPPGRSAPLRVQVRNWPADNVQLEVPASLPPPQRQKYGAGQSWIVQLPPGLPDRIPLRLKGDMAIAKLDHMPMPDISIVGASAQARWLGVLGPELMGSPGTSVKPATEIASSLALWPEQAKQIQGEGTLWKILADDWRLTVKTRPAFADPAVQVVSCEQESALTPEGRWTHEASIHLLVRDGGDIRLLLPGQSKLLAMELDGSPAHPGRAGNHWRVSLPRPAGPHLLRVRWQHGPAEEAIDAPNLATPAIAGVDNIKIAGAVWLPAGFREGSLTRGQPLSAAQWMLARARAQLHLCTLLAQNRKNMDAGEFESAMRRAQERFYWCCRQAEYSASRAGKDASALAAAKELQQDNASLAEKHQFAKIQKSAAKSANLREPAAIRGLSSLGSGGIARYWQADASQPPVLRLVAVAAEQTRGRLLATQGVVMALMGLLILSFLPIVARFGRALWPEQILLLACLGWLAFGPSLPGMILALIGVAARVVLLVAWGQRWLLRRAATTGGGSSLHPSGG